MIRWLLNMIIILGFLRWGLAAGMSGVVSPQALGIGLIVLVFFLAWTPRRPSSPLRTLIRVVMAFYSLNSFVASNTHGNPVEADAAWQGILTLLVMSTGLYVIARGVTPHNEND
jgi:hypothetical protein